MTQGDPIRGTDFKTGFSEMGLKQLKGMIEGANPGLVKEVGEHYEAVAKDLAGEHGILQQFEKAVNKVLETWHGKSADRFRKRAIEISQNISKGANEVQHTAGVMATVASALQAAVDAVSAVEEPSFLERGADKLGDTLGSPGGAATALAPPGLAPIVYGGAKMMGVDVGRSDQGLHRDLAAGVSTRQALENNSGSLSAGKEAALQAAIPMEALAAAYQKGAKDLDGGSGHGGYRPPGTPGGPNNPDVGSVGPVPSGMPSGGGAGAYKPTSPGGISMPSSDIAAPRTSGIPGGGGGGSQIGTGLSGFNGGSGGIGPGGGGVGGGLGAGGLGGGVGAGGAGSGSGVTGVPGMPGGMAAGGAGAAGSRGGARPGMPGAAGAGAAGAGGAKGAGRGGSLARQRGGIVGAAKGAGGGAQGGSGLHRSRGGTQAGQPGAGRGMAGAPGAHGASGNRDDRRGERPDYLVEEEETWTPQRNVAPRVIE